MDVSEHHFLPVSDGREIAYRLAGAARGRPVLVLHGGPGSGSSARRADLFDPMRWRVVLADQRGCGASRPHAGDDLSALEANTTAHLIADCERLRAALGFERWTVAGHSWGATLALAYAEAHPDRVDGLILLGATTSRASEIAWLFTGLAQLFPAEWEAFSALAPEAADLPALLRAYDAAMRAPDQANAAARAWLAWEDAILALEPVAARPDRWADPRAAMARARLSAHYFANGCFLAEDQILREAAALADIPGVIIQGRLDLQAPLATAWALARAWPAARLQIVEGAGHIPDQAAFAARAAAAISAFADRIGSEARPP